MNVQLPLAVGLSPGQPAITPLDPADDAPNNFAEFLAETPGSGDAEPGQGGRLESSPLGSDLPDPDQQDIDAPTGLLVQSVGTSAAEALGASSAAARADSTLAVPVAATQAAEAAQAALTDAGRAAAPSAPAVTLAPDASGSPRTLDSAPWFAVRAADADARGQALARAVQPALQDATPLATREAQGGAPQSTMTSLGTAANVQAMVEGDLAVRAPDLVARAVGHNVARGALLQAQRAQIDLPQQVLAEATSGADAGTLAAGSPAAADAAPDEGAAPGPERPSPTPATAAPARAGAPAAAAPLAAEVPGGVEAPGAPAVPDATTAASRGVTPGGSAPSDAALAAGRPTQAQLGQVAVPDADHMELKVSDGEHSFRLSIAREADGLNVELKAPREIVADLRALEPDVEAALAEDGYDLASFDAQADDSQSDGSAGDDSGQTADGAGTVSGDAQDAATPGPVAPAGQGHLLNRLA